jgi:polygalacturonase
MIHKKLICIFFLVSLSGCSTIGQSADPNSGHTFNILNYGAVGDGKTNCTAAVQKAIDACAAAGGGRVMVPAGIFLIGPINLASDMDLHLEKDAELLCSRNFGDYPLVYASFLGKDTVQHASPITARNLHDISITGPGVIDGQGDAWRTIKKSKLTAEQWDRIVQSGGMVNAKADQWWPSRSAMENTDALAALRESNAPPRMEDYVKFRDLLRPDMVALIHCDHLLLDGPTFRNSPFWAVQVLRCHNVVVRNCTIFNELWAQNGDGIGFDSSRDILMEDCTVYAGDDNIVLKSGKDEEGRRYHLPTENVTIRRCTSMWGHGGFVLGSETSGDIRHVRITDCVCNGTDVGLRFKSVRGRGGIVEDIHVDHVTMSNITMQAILFDMFYEKEDSKPEPLSVRTPCFRNFDIRNITCQSAGQSLWINGLAELPVSDIRFENMHLIGDKGAVISEAKDVTFKHVQIESKSSPAFSTQNAWGLNLQDLQTKTQN